jgi:transposase
MKRKTEAEAVIGAKWADLAPLLDECSRRRWAATEARAVGYGGVVAVARATGLSRTTVFKGLAELGAEGGAETPARVRREGGGRMRLIARDPGLDTALDHLIDPIVRGDPESPLRWTTKSTEKLAAALRELGHKVSSSTVWRMLRAKGYRLQSTKKTLERRHHDDRDAQFIYIAGAVKDFHAAGDPAISVDTKKKELIGEFANGGREWHPSGAPVEVLGHDFPNEAIGKAIPYGVYDIGLNEALVNVGVNCDTSAFAVESIRRWWDLIGSKRYPDSKRLLITADAGGSNGYRRRTWKKALQELATEAGLSIHVVHFPPGTSKWNKIEHRLFCHLSKNWRGRPLYDYTTIIELIGATTTKTGLRVKAVLDSSEYALGEKVSEAEMRGLSLEKSPWHGEWNYTLHPVQS